MPKEIQITVNPDGTTRTDFSGGVTTEITQEYVCP
jgi:hypothetical protein